MSCLPAEMGSLPLLSSWWLPTPLAEPGWPHIPEITILGLPAQQHRGQTAACLGLSAWHGLALSPPRMEVSRSPRAAEGQRGRP